MVCVMENAQRTSLRATLSRQTSLVNPIEVVNASSNRLAAMMYRSKAGLCSVALKGQRSMERSFNPLAIRYA